MNFNVRAVSIFYEAKKGMLMDMARNPILESINLSVDATPPNFMHTPQEWKLLATSNRLSGTKVRSFSRRRRRVHLPGEYLC